MPVEYTETVKALQKAADAIESAKYNLEGDSFQLLQIGLIMPATIA